MKKINKIQKKHIKVGDQVKVITGKHKGVLGNISSIVTKKSLVTIEGIIPRMKYVKNPNKTETGNSNESKKIELPIFIHVSNVMLWDKLANLSSRISYKMNTNLTIPKKERYFKKSGNFLP